MMQANRRDFLKNVGCLTAAGTGLALGAHPSAAAACTDPVGVLVDTTACVGCRLCEYACKQANHMEAGTLESYSDTSVFQEKRRPSPTSLTVVNQYTTDDGKHVYVKTNCMHCNQPAGASACIVGAMEKRENGAVTYDAWKCIGCRYCMVACPFQIPAYEYDNVLTPQVRKCQLCFQERTRQGKPPACVEACPREALIFGKRSELLTLAHETIEKHPDKYVNQIYGEHEVGGTSWMYLASVPFEQIGFQKLGTAAPPALTEKIQRGIFRRGVGPFGLLAFLGGIMLLTRSRKGRAKTRVVSLPVLPSVAAASVAARGAIFNLPTAGLPPKGEEEQVRPLEVRVVEHEAHAEHDEEPQPVNAKLFSPGAFVLLALMAFGLVSAVWRFRFGFASSTHLDQQHPWGLWVGIDVATGVALAAGGFVAAALAAVFHRETYRPLVRPALLTAMLGYTAVVTGLQADLGRYYNVWHPLVPTMWQGNSVLFEVGTCEFICLNLLYMIFLPVLVERLRKNPNRFPRLLRVSEGFVAPLEKAMPVLIIVGCVAALLHQSALGNLLVITPYKLHPLWHTPVLSLLFLISAIGGGGFAMMVFESLLASWSLKLKPEMHVLSSLARFIPPVMGLYLVAKLADMYFRHTYSYLGHLNLLSVCWVLEVGLGVLVPVLMLLFKRVRHSPRLLFVAATLIVFGVVFNRINVFLIGYHPPYSKPYFPSAAEFGITLGLMAALMFFYRLIVIYFPVISQERKGAAA
jgi:Ni/Fe-hydrogenase subunit HybB-like protein/Fe-S-cluster-containing dehydrogenase component